MKRMSIGQIARRTGVAATALRYYEEAGLLPPPPRVHGRRVYDADSVRRIDVLRFAQKAGFSLEEIRTLLRGVESTSLSSRWQTLARAKLSELDVMAQQIEQMRRALQIGLQCGCAVVEECTLSPAEAVADSAPRQKSCCG
jgi:MerR family transcriptional regulator, redox-sensitive transcriptional activator SoxR